MFAVEQKSMFKISLEYDLSVCDTSEMHYGYASVRPAGTPENFYASCSRTDFQSSNKIALNSSANFYHIFGNGTDYLLDVGATVLAAWPGITYEILIAADVPHAAVLTKIDTNQDKLPNLNSRERIVYPQILGKSEIKAAIRESGSTFVLFGAQPVQEIEKKFSTEFNTDKNSFVEAFLSSSLTYGCFAHVGPVSTETRINTERIQASWGTSILLHNGRTEGYDLEASLADPSPTVDTTYYWELIAFCVLCTEQTEREDMASAHSNAETLQINSGDAVKRALTCNYEAIPMLAPVFKNRGIEVRWGASSDKSDLQIPFNFDSSALSSAIARRFWDSAENAIVVNNYAGAVLSSQIGCLLNAPLLIYGSTTDEILEKLGVESEDIISVGDTPYTKGTVLKTQDDVLDFMINLNGEKINSMNYIAVANPEDMESSAVASPSMSSFAPLFAAYHNGMVVISSDNSTLVNEEIKNCISKLNDAGAKPRHVCLVGDYSALNATYITTDQYDGNGFWLDYKYGTPSDNPYGDLDSNPMTIELAVGRIIARNLNEMSNYFGRISNYKKQISNEKYPEDANSGLNVMLGSDWNNNAITYFGSGTEHMAPDSELSVNQMFKNAKFDVQDDSPQAKTNGYVHAVAVGGPIITQEISGPLLAADFAKSNFIAMDADHGCPEGTATLWNNHLVDMNPGAFFAVSCSLGCIDTVDHPYTSKSNSFTYEMLGHGMAIYVAATRSALGSYDGMPNTPLSEYQPRNAPGLCYLYFKYMIDENLTSGEALMKAKNELVNNGYVDVGGNAFNDYTSWEYAHYGDPAFNPYDPWNEGGGKK
jgi:hypothetical protein